MDTEAKRTSFHGKSPEHLYIIGNGFDLYHGAQASYAAFRDYLLKHAPDAVKSFELYFGPRSLERSFAGPRDLRWCLAPGSGGSLPRHTWTSDHLWLDFEKYLCELNREKVFDLLDMFLPRKFGEDEDFSLADYLMPVDRIRESVHACTFEMNYHLHRWINTLHYRKGFRRKMLHIDPNAVFLNFNYTLFLESEYGIPPERILYIHGSRREKFGSLVIGHNADDWRNFREWIHKNRNRRRYRPNLKDRRGHYFSNDQLAYLTFFLEEKACGNWRNPIRYYAANHAEEELEGYYAANFKNTAEIIRRNAAFFGSLSDVREIAVAGHSFGEVDRPYFEEIVRSLSDPAQVRWNFSYHTDADLQRIGNFCRCLNIPRENNTRSFRLSEISIDRTRTCLPARRDTAPFGR